MERRTLVPFFDSAYQGYASGDLDADVFPVRLFLEKGLNVGCQGIFSLSPLALLSCFRSLLRNRIRRISVFTANVLVLCISSATHLLRRPVISQCRILLISFPFTGSRSVAARSDRPRHILESTKLRSTYRSCHFVEPRKV